MLWSTFGLQFAATALAFIIIAIHEAQLRIVCQAAAQRSDRVLSLCISLLVIFRFIGTRYRARMLCFVLLFCFALLTRKVRNTPNTRVQ